MNKLQEARNRSGRKSRFPGLPKKEKIEEIRAFLYKNYKFNKITKVHLRAAYASVMFCFASQGQTDYLTDILLSMKIIKSVRTNSSQLYEYFTLIPRMNNAEELAEYSLDLF